MIPALERWTGDHAMTKDTTKAAAVAADIMLFDNWFDPIEDGVRARVRGFIETMLEEELDEALSRPRYGRRKASDNDAPASVVGCRHGHRKRTLTGTFGKTEIAVPRARVVGEDGKTREWKSKSLRAYQRRTKAADALIAGAYLAGTNTRRVRRALKAAFAGEVGKDVVSRTWRKVKGDWNAWNARSLTDEPIIRLILDGTVVRVRLDRRPPRSRCSSRWACGRTAKRCCWRSRTWAARARQPGGHCSTISSNAA
jgi:transposase-like protein